MGGGRDGEGLDAVSDLTGWERKSGPPDFVPQTPGHGVNSQHELNDLS